MPKYDYPTPPRTGSNTIGDYYDNKDRARNHWHFYWQRAICLERPAAEVAWLERKMHEAGNTGD